MPPCTKSSQLKIMKTTVSILNSFSQIDLTVDYFVFIIGKTCHQNGRVRIRAEVEFTACLAKFFLPQYKLPTSC